LSLLGLVSYTGTVPAIQWKLYSGPTPISFGSPSQTNTTVTFTAPGTYTLLLSADDGVHAVAYDAAVVTVTPVVTLSVARSGTNLVLTWSGGSAPYVLESSANLGTWTPILTNNGQSTTLPVASTNLLFRVRAH
jgi:hypothetical protein